MIPLAELKSRLERQGFDAARNHFEQAESALARREWEAANAQTRSALEALFNGVAQLRLGTNKTGGSARKQLEERGILQPREASLVKSFMEVAGGSGSHAGTSNEDEAKGRFLVAAGIILIALALVPDVVRVEDILTEQLTAPPGARHATDAEIQTECPTCGTKQFLSQATIRRDSADSVYYCRNGCQPIVVVGRPGESAWPGRGYRLGDHVIRNARDLYVPVPAADNTIAAVLYPSRILIPASPAALMKQRPDAPSV
jgi:hypothetical protein